MKKFYFSLDYSGEVEDLNIYDDTTEKEVRKVIETIKSNPDMMISEHRTRGEVSIHNGMMIVEYEYFNEPEWNEFDELLLKIPL